MSISVEEQKQKVWNLRSQGFTLSEISKETGLRKGTLSRWLKGVIFSKEIVEKIAAHAAEKKVRGLSQSKLSKDIKKKFGERNALIEAKKVFEKFKKDPLFISGIIFYWSNGSFSNNYFQFSTGDETKLLFMLDWLAKYQQIGRKDLKYRLFCAEGGVKEVKTHWQGLLGIPMDFPTSYTKLKNSKNVENKGVLQILYYKQSLNQKMQFWQKLFLEYYK